MAVTLSQKNAIEEVIQALMNATSRRVKRRLVEMFLELPDREAWPEYYEVIPEPRCINAIQADLAKDKYKQALNVYTDLDLVFLNALYYNEESSQIAKDATTLKALLESEWKQHAALPIPHTSPPPSSAQKVHAQPTAADTFKAKSPSKNAASAPAPALATQTTPATEARSPERPMTPDMDVDVGGTPEPEGPSNDAVRDAESDDIVRQLERGLPRWEGLGDKGWMDEVDPERWLSIVLAISEHKNESGVRLATSIEAVPEEASVPELPFTTPLSLALIESRARAKHYESSKAVDKEISYIFMKARRWHEPGSEAYGNVLVLQRLYNALTSISPPPGPPYTSTTNFASLRAGPGHAKPLHTTDTEGVPGVTTYRVSTKDRTFVEEVHYKGWSIRLADWLHLSNPDDPSKPIIGQVFKCFVSEEPARKGQPGMTVCWYYRPEQTFHPAHRQFWDKEIFKTSHFADHPLEDIIEKIACQFTARHIRGRPRPPYWYPGWPLYVCDSRYNDKERIFVKIKNWNSCVPEEVRKSTEFMPIYPFERTVFPLRFASPFVTGKPIKAPGGIGDVIEKAEGEKIEGGGTGRKRPRKNAPGGATATPSRTDSTDRGGPSKGLYVGPPLTTAGAPEAASTSAYPNPSAAAMQNSRQQSMQPRADRSIVTAAGGAASGGNILTEKLAPETAKHFDRNPETNEVLWFSAPPVDFARTPAPRHSLAYLHFLARKRKREGEDVFAMDVSTDQPPPKQQKVPPTMTETIASMMSKFRVTLPPSDATTV